VKIKLIMVFNHDKFFIVTVQAVIFNDHCSGISGNFYDLRPSVGPTGPKSNSQKIKAMRKQNSITLRSNPRARASSPQQFGESTTATRLEEITD